MIHRLVCLVTAALVFTLPFSGAGASPSGNHQLSFLDGLSLVVVDADDISSLHLARRVIQSYGGTVAIMSPPSLLLGWVPFETREALVGTAGIREIYYTEVFPGEIQTSGAQSEAMVGFFNSAVRGDLAVEYEELARAAAAEGLPAAREPDVLPRDPIDQEAYLENLRAAGLDADALVREGILPDLSSPETTGNSDYMTGTVALTVFFVESDGSGSDPDLYTWTPQAMQSYVNGVNTALAWWSSQARNRGDCWVTFLINYHSGADPRCQQWTEPILHDPMDGYESIWVTEIMAKFGFTSGSRFDRVTAFNTWQRSYYETHRSYSAFVPYNPAPAATTFPGGLMAYAYWYGPYTVLLYRVQGWTTTQVFAHETGHIFGACDEYSGGCGSWSCGSICTNGTVNGNCEDCNPDSRDCMMKENSFTICTYTAKHVGWQVTTPCAPPEPPLLPSPTLASVGPAYGGHGTDLTVTVQGSNFYAGVKLDLGSDIFVHKITLVGQTAMHADVSIFASAPPGPRDVRVINRDGQHMTLPGGFEVRPTTRHYYSPAGGNTAPYVTPTEAATTLMDALSATYDGDTLFVTSGTFDAFSIIVDRGVLLYGGWNETFSARNLETGKTVLNLTSNVTFVAPGGASGLDGFLLENGTGATDVNPFPARFGGAVRFIGGTAIVADCEIRANSAGGEMEYGVGGAIFANGSVVDIRNNSIHGNSASQGGALYLIGCTGTVANNAISGNSVEAVGYSPVGAGIVIMSSSDLVLDGNAVSANMPAQEGGGIYVENSQGVVVRAGTVEGNEAAFSGGGMVVKNSSVTIEGVEFSGNSSAALGGAVSSLNNSNLAVSGASFSSNHALAGGGIYSGQGHFSLRHSLFTGNTASTTGGALVAIDALSGEVAGNTLDGNASPNAGGMLIGLPAAEVYNNIVVNSTGTGISCSGAAPALLAYNLVWGSSGSDYSDCAPGVGSLSDDPLFAAPAAGDYRLGLHSPAIDAGRPGPLYGDPDGSRGDMGIYGSHDFEMDQPSYPKNLAASRQLSHVLLQWDRNPENDVANYAVYGDLTADFMPGASTFITLVAASDSSVTLDPPADSLYYRVSAVDTDGYAGGYSAAALYSPTTTSVHRPTSYAFALHQNVPNPFNPSTRISYELSARAPVALRVYDVDGRLVRTLVDAAQGPGSLSVTWDGRNDAGGPVASGVYFYRLTAAGLGVQTKKMVFVK